MTHANEYAPNRLIILGSAAITHLYISQPQPGVVETFRSRGSNHALLAPASRQENAVDALAEGHFFLRYFLDL